MSPIKKSTIVRTKVLSLRAAFWIGERVAPRVGARAAASLWFKLPPGPKPAALPDGATPFEVESTGHTVRGLTWGDGPVVYALHGWGGRGDQFAAFVEPLVSVGYRVVVFDALSHGASDDGPSGRGRAHGIEFGRALDAVAARFGPARAVVAHSMGAVSALLAMRDGWVGTESLVLVSPMSELSRYFDRFGALVGFGPRIRRGLDVETLRRTGYSVDAVSLPRLADDLAPLPSTLIIHDRADKETSYDASVALTEALANARLISTDGLGHRRILRDPGVVAATIAHVLAADQRDDRVDAIA